MSHEQLGEIPLTEDEAEAASQKYWAWKILRLQSGRYAVWNPGYGLVAITDAPLEQDLSYAAARKTVREQNRERELEKKAEPKGTLEDFM